MIDLNTVSVVGITITKIYDPTIRAAFMASDTHSRAVVYAQVLNQVRLLDGDARTNAEESMAFAVV